MTETGQPDWLIEDKIPFIWVIDDANQGFPHPDASDVSLFDGDYFGNLRTLVDKFGARISFNFVIAPEYVKAGLAGSEDLETPMTHPAWKPYHAEMQDWLAELGDRGEVAVHGWTHRMADYRPEVEINREGWQYTRRSEWLFHPDPVGNFRRNMETMRNLGYEPITQVLSTCGGRMDRDTFRRLRNSEYQVLVKFPTQDEACRADYPEAKEMPWYLPDLDAFVFPWSLTRNNGYEDFEDLWRKRKPIFLVNHGHEFGTKRRSFGKLGLNPEVRSVEAMQKFYDKHREDLVFLRLGEYVQLIHERVQRDED